MSKIIGALLLVFCFAVQADERECDGTFSISLDSSNVEYREQEGISAWMTGEVRVTGALRHCAKEITLKPIHSNRILLTGPGHSLQGKLYNSGYFALTSNFDGGYQLPLDSSGTTQFRLRLPSAGFSPAGSYQSRLQAMLDGDLRQPTRLLDINYRSIPVVAMKVSTASAPWLSQMGNSYRVDMGEMTKGSKRNIWLEMKSNASVSIRIESHHGRLKHSSINNEYIDYSLRLYNESWSPDKVYQRSIEPMQAKRYTRVPFSIEVRPQPRALAGEYSDRLTITLTAR